jgi:hypothetical protein
MDLEEFEKSWSLAKRATVAIAIVSLAAVGVACWAIGVLVSYFT